MYFYNSLCNKNKFDSQKTYLSLGVRNTNHICLTLKNSENVLNGKCKKDGYYTCNCNGCFSRTSKVCCSSFSEDN